MTLYSSSGVTEWHIWQCMLSYLGLRSRSSQALVLNQADMSGLYSCFPALFSCYSFTYCLIHAIPLLFIEFRCVAAKCLAVICYWVSVMDPWAQRRLKTADRFFCKPCREAESKPSSLMPRCAVTMVTCRLFYLACPHLLPLNQSDTILLGSCFRFALEHYSQREGIIKDCSTCICE